MRAIDSDKAIEVAQIKYNDWNLAMAAADGRREINLCFKKQELFKAVKAVLDCVPTLTPPNEWVSVENAVPDPGERVLATDGTFVGEAYRTSANTWYRHTGFPWRDCLQSIVTLWMPLPTADKDNHVPAKAPNEPLTIEQLREMKDEPAYLKVFDPLLKSGWHIIKAVTKDKIIFRGWQTVYVPIDGMGVDYNLYRRPPEGEEGNI